MIPKWPLSWWSAEKQIAISSQAEVDAKEQNRVSTLQQFDNREQLRAVIGPPAIISTPGFNAETKHFGYVTLVSFHNFGGARTGEFNAWASVNYFDKDVPYSQDFTKPFKPLGKIQKGIVGANGNGQVVVGLSNEDYDKSVNKEGLVIVWGQAHYSDIFEPNKIHVVRFCVNVNPTTVNGQMAFNPIPYRPDCNTAS